MSQQMLCSVTGAARGCSYLRRWRDGSNLKGFDPNILQLSGFFVGGPETLVQPMF